MVVKGVIGRGVGQIDINAKCLGIEVQAISIECSKEECDVALKRFDTTAEQEIAGVRLVFSESGGATEIFDLEGNIHVLETKVDTIILSEIIWPANQQALVAPYFKDEQGNKHVCPQATTFLVAPGECDAEHLYFCESEENCGNNGGIWNNSIIPECQPQAE